MLRSLIDFLVVAALAFGASACSGSAGGSPIGPGGPGGSTGSGAVISGTVIGRASSGQGVAHTLDSSSTLTVRVNGTSLMVTVDASGRFELTGVPPGNVELEFSDGSTAWIVVLMDVAAGERIEIQINLSSGIPSIVSQSRSK